MRLFSRVIHVLTGQMGHLVHIDGPDHYVIWHNDAVIDSLTLKVYPYDKRFLETLASTVAAANQKPSGEVPRLRLSATSSHPSHSQN